MATVLIIEDEADLCRILTFNLERAGHRVVVASAGREGLLAAERHKPDVILLDLMLPDLQGTEVCRELRRGPQKEAVIIMMTAKGEEIDRVVGFEVGADDYVVKPFSVRELVLRVEAAVRRRQREQPPLATFGDLRVDTEAHRVWVEDKEVELTALEFRLLMTLFQRKNRVQSRAQLLDDVWGIQAEITTRTVDTHVKRLREKLGVAGDYVETVRGVGYRFAESPASSKDDAP